MVNQRWNAIVDWLWPGRCPLCRGRSRRGGDLCHGCHGALPWLHTACQRCAAPLASAARVCGQCQRKPPPFDRAYAAVKYEKPVDRLVLNLKYHRRLDLARTLGELLATCLQGRADAMVDFIVPVPLHTSRLRERGYNQSLEIARVVARRLGAPMAPRAARRVRATAAQTALPLTQRARNVRNAFAVDGSLRGKRVAIVDDVMTSSHTVGALAKALRRAGVKQISVWVVARA
jgi:ComF family protein